MNNNTEQKAFEWTTELVKECIYFCHDINHRTGTTLPEYWGKDLVQEFIKLKQQPIEERIVVKVYDDDVTKMRVGYHRANICISKPIPREKHEAVKLAIEGVLNNETWLQQQEQIKRDKFKAAAALQLEQMQKDELYHKSFDNPTPQPQDTKVEVPQGYGILMPTGAVTNPDGSLKKAKPEYMDKSIWMTKEQLDSMMENVWDAARLVNAVAGMKFETFKDYHKSLPENKKQDTKEDNPKEVANNLLQQGTITLAETVLVLNKENWEDASKKLKEILDAKKAPKEEQKSVLFTTEDMTNIVMDFLSAGCPNFPKDERGSWLKWVESYIEKLANTKINIQ